MRAARPSRLPGAKRTDLCTRLAGLLMTLAEFEFECRRYSASVAAAARLLDLGAKRATFPLWRRAKDITSRSLGAQREIKRLGRAFFRRARASAAERSQAARDLARRAREEEASRLAEARRPVQEQRRMRRRRRIAARREAAGALRAEAAAARERRREKSREKAREFAKAAARRRADREAASAAGGESAAGLSADMEAVRRALEESDRECRRQAERIAAMRKDLEEKARVEEEERRAAVKIARRANALKRRRMRAQRERERAEERERERVQLQEALAEERARRRREEEERAAEEEEERAFAVAERKAREDAESATPVCIFCGRTKQSAEEACARCFAGERDVGGGLDEGLDEASDALWDFDSGGVEGIDGFGGLVEIADAVGADDAEDGFGLFDGEEILGAAIPDEWCCPLTLECFRDPVRMVEDGQVYERSAILLWFERGNTTSPMTNVDVGSRPTLLEESELRGAIDRAIEEAMEELAGGEEEEEEGEGRGNWRRRMGREDSGSEAETPAPDARSPVSILVRNSDDAVAVCWSRAIQDGGEDDDKAVPSNAPCRSRLARVAVHSEFRWIVLCVSSGRFAAGVFRRGTLVDHKTISRYTTRRKQGGAQANNDQHGGGKAKSAGATLRRYNELEFHKDVQSLLASERWKDHLEEADRIWVCCAGKASGRVLWEAPQGHGGGRRRIIRRRGIVPAVRSRRATRGWQKCPFRRQGRRWRRPRGYAGARQPASSCRRRSARRLSAAAEVVVVVGWCRPRRCTRRSGGGFQERNSPARHGCQKRGGEEGAQRRVRGGASVGDQRRAGVGRPGGADGQAEPRPRDR